MKQNPGPAFDQRANSSDVPVRGAADQSFRFELEPETKHDRERKDEERVRLAVLTALHWDLAVPRDRVQVRVDRSWVTLTGEVRREYERSSAEADARRTRGVSGVTNEIICGSAAPIAK